MKNKTKPAAPAIPNPKWKPGIFYQIARCDQNPVRTNGLVSLPWGLGISRPLDEKTDYVITHLHSGLKTGYRTTSLQNARALAHIIRRRINTAQDLTAILEDFRRQGLHGSDLTTPFPDPAKKARP